jgi:hypothetical protein
MKASLIITVDKGQRIAKAMDELARDQVLVGWPAGQPARKDDNMNPEEFTNAAIGYIAEYGAPEVNIPPRPVLLPGIRDAKDKINKLLGDAARAALDGDQAKKTKTLGWLRRQRCVTRSPWGHSFRLLQLRLPRAGDGAGQGKSP